MHSLALRTVVGEQIRPHLQALARLRIEVFRAFPYLYDGDADYEEQYLGGYADIDQAAVVLAFDGDQIVGASSCMPMACEIEALRGPWQHKAAEYGFDADLAQLFYCAESVLDPRYRGQGIGKQFFAAREAHAQELGGFSHSCFCAVDRPTDHPMRPRNYTPLDRFWQRRGYVKQTNMQAYLSWKDIDQPKEDQKQLRFWLKALI